MSVCYWRSVASVDEAVVLVVLLHLHVLVELLLSVQSLAELPPVHPLDLEASLGTWALAAPLLHLPAGVTHRYIVTVLPSPSSTLSLFLATQ